MRVASCHDRFAALGAVGLVWVLTARERAADLSDEILRAIADGKIFAMCRGVKVDADVVEAARVELDRRGAAVGE